MAKNRQLTDEEEVFVRTMADKLPPVIARKHLFHFLGGIVARKTVSNADAVGDGPKASYRLGRTIVYDTEPLLIWLVKRLGVKKLRHIDTM
jgi:hypothetical protein